MLVVRVLTVPCTCMVGHNLAEIRSHSGCGCTSLGLLLLTLFALSTGTSISDLLALSAAYGTAAVLRFSFTIDAWSLTSVTLVGAVFL
jgi:hypothetical protein